MKVQCTTYPPGPNDGWHGVPGGLTLQGYCASLASGQLAVGGRRPYARRYCNMTTKPLQSTLMIGEI